MKIKGSLRAYLIAHIIGTAMICTFLVAGIILYYTNPYMMSTLHNIVFGKAKFYEYALLLALILRIACTWTFLKRRGFFYILFFAELVLNGIVVVVSEYPDYNVAIPLLVLDAPLMLYLLFSKTVHQFIPFTYAKTMKTAFERWMYNHMAMDQFPEENTDDYLLEFQRAQENQNMQWKYPLAGQRTPLDEAQGNALLYSFFFFVPAWGMLAIIIVLLVNVRSSRLDASFYAGMAVLAVFCMFFLFIGWRYVQLHYRRKYVAKMRGIEKQRKRKRYKTDKDG